MKFSTGFWDWLFGSKVKVELPNGAKVRVSERWLIRWRLTMLCL